MKIIKIANESAFNSYDAKVAAGKWSNYKSGKDSPILKTPDGRSYKIYQCKIGYAQRLFGRGLPGLFSLIVLAPLWSKTSRNLWKEAWCGKEKIKVITDRKANPTISKTASHQKVGEIQPTKDVEMQKVSASIHDSITQCLNQDIPPSSLSVYLKLVVDDKLIQKQFIVNCDGNSMLDKEAISQKIQNQITSGAEANKPLKSAKTYVLNILCVGYAQSTKLHVYVARDNISKTTHGKNQKIHPSEISLSYDLEALNAAAFWLKDHMPANAQKIRDMEGFIKIEGIYQEL